jgi:hypothetical protein
VSRALINEKTQNLERIRSEKAALAATHASLTGEVQRAAAAAKAAQVDAVVTPGRESQSRADGAAKALEAVVAKRDAAEDRAGLLELAERQLEGEIRELDDVLVKAARAAAVLELTRRLDAGRPKAREWIVQAIAEAMIKGVIVGDLGLAAVQALEPGQYTGLVEGSIRASAVAIQESINRGEVFQ